MKEKKTLVFATNNEHKLSEVRSIVGDRFDIRSLAEIGCHDDIPETGNTLEANALQKARWVKDKYGFDCFADDTGLSVVSLGGAPGVMTARYAGDHCKPADNIAKLLRELDGITDRRAAFSTVIALIYNGCEYTVEGRIDGKIAERETGTDGFGYDPVFIPDETGLSFAQMGADAKNTISHRGRAVNSLLELLETL